MGDKEVIVNKGAEILSNPDNSTTIFIVASTVVMVFILYIWKDKEKSNNKKHEDHEKRHDETKGMIQKLIDLQDGQQLILTKLELKSEYQEEATKEIKELLK